MKPLIIIAIIALVIGGALFGFAAIQNGGFDFQPTVTRTETVDDNFDKILAGLDVADTEILPATDGKCTLVIVENEKRPHTVSVKDGVLRIDRTEKKWYEHISLFPTRYKITLYLPETDYTALNIEADTGDVTVDKAFTFRDIDIKSDTGKIELYASAENTCALETDTGKITVKNVSAASFSAERSTGNLTVDGLTVSGSAFIEGSTGRTELNHIDVGGRLTIETNTGDMTANTLKAESLSINGDTSRIHVTNAEIRTTVDIKNDTGDVSLANMKAASLSLEIDTGDSLLTDCILTESIRIDSNTGDVTFGSSDAPAITVITDTGRVSGSLLTGKMFNAQSDTGKITVPEDSAVGGRCNITTDTGNINITIK